MSDTTERVTQLKTLLTADTFVARFLRDIEERKVEPLIGGEALNIVASDKDKDKMDITEIIRRFET